MTLITLVQSRHPGWTLLIDRWLTWQRAGGARKATLELRSSQLRRLAVDLAERDPLTLTTDDLATWLTARPHWSQETLRSHRSAVRSFYGWLVDSEQLAVDPSRKLRPVKAGPVIVRGAGDESVTAGLAASPRVALMVALGVLAGLRRGEIVQVHSRDLIAGPAGWSLQVHGKGGKERTVPLNPDIARALVDWPAGYAFPSSTHGGHLTAAYVAKLMKKAMGGATSHQLRHRYANRVFRGTRNLETVRVLLGHASVATTQRYVYSDDEQLRAGVQFAG